MSPIWHKATSRHILQLSLSHVVKDLPTMHAKEPGDLLNKELSLIQAAPADPSAIPLHRNSPGGWSKRGANLDPCQ